MDDESVVEAVRRDLADLAERAEPLSRSALAMTALALARELDGSSSATSKSMCAKALVETMARLRELAPEKREGGKLDDLTRKRAERLAPGRAVS
jgi:broad specificity phosphatase PhoE